MNQLLNAALSYAARGWQVFPCHCPRPRKNGSIGCSCGKVDCAHIGKHPRTRSGLKEATTDADQINQWWEKWPDANVAIATGADSGLIVLDIDGAEGEEIFAQYPAPDATYEIKSGNGRQLYFTYPDLPDGQRIKTVPNVVPSLDSRGDKNGYVIAPPSLHANGNRYEIVADIALAQAPDWWLEMVTVDDNEAPGTPRDTPPLVLDTRGEYRAYVNAAVERETEKLRGAPIGEQNEQLNKSSFSLGQIVGAGALSEGDARQSLINAALSLTPAAGRDAWTERSALPTIESGLRSGMNKPRVMPERRNYVVLLRGGAARSYVAGKPTEYAEADQEDAPEAEGADEDERSANAGFYAIQNGRTVIAVSKTKENANGSNESTNRQFVSDFAAYIDAVVQDEDGNQVLECAVRHVTGREYRVQLEASQVKDPKYVAGQFYNALAQNALIYAGMEKHLVASIFEFSRHFSPKLTRQFYRTGWTDKGEFLIPGMEPPDVTLSLDKELAYRVEPDHGDVSEPLTRLLSAHLPHFTLIAFVHALGSVLARKAGFEDEKFALFATGRSGTFKTSWMQMLMSIFGDFGADDKLLRFGAGGTLNALMSFPVSACDLPLLIDNFKPGTGNGARDAQTLIHALLEGTERKRLTREGKRRESREIRCWPAFTGEDTIHDAASIARMLIINVSFPHGDENPDLTWCQSNVGELQKIGGAWIKWLLSDECDAAINRFMPLLIERRGVWVEKLRRANSEMVNAMRVASSLAVVEMVWEIAKQCPAFAETLPLWDAHLDAALNETAGNMANYSAESHEAQRFISTLRGLVVGQKAYLAKRIYDADKDDRRAFIGWEDDDFVYLLPQNAFAAALDALKLQNGLNGLEMNTISKQLDQLGYLVAKDGAHYAPKRKMGAETGRVRVLIIPRAKFMDDDEGADGE